MSKLKRVSNPGVSRKDYSHTRQVKRQRLAEMARKEASEAIRQAARKLVPELDETTASLPSCPARRV